MPQVIFKKANGTLAYVHNHNVIVSLRNSSVRMEQGCSASSNVSGGLKGVYTEDHISKARRQGEGGTPKPHRGSLPASRA